MNARTFLLGAAAVCAVLPALAQMPSADEIKAASRQTKEAAKASPATKLRDLIGRTRDNTVSRYNAVRVAQDLAGCDVPADATFTWYAIPPLSTIQRLPDMYPPDGEAAAPLRVVACRDEFEPASFVVYPFADAAKVTIRPGDLRTSDGKVIKADKVDIKVVKVWYQNGNGWYSYFNDTGIKLIPELLLHDENLIKVDTQKKANFVRISLPDGREVHEWVSQPNVIDYGFNVHGEPVNDADTLQPVAFSAGEFKQLMVTIKIDKDAAPGLYLGNIAVEADNGGKASVPIRLRVLPYVLPAPKTYYDYTADFYTMLYGPQGHGTYFKDNGRDSERAYAKQYTRTQNWYDHNVRNPLYLGIGSYKDLSWFERTLQQCREIGMQLDPLFEAYSCNVWPNADRHYHVKRNAAIAAKEFKRLLGHSNIYPAGAEEPGPQRVVNTRPGWRMAHEVGHLVMCNGGDRRYYSGYADDFRIAGAFAELRQADFMHRIRGKIGNYAGPHTGPENPEFMRRMHGINLYKKDYDMMYNYAYNESAWNDHYSGCYRITLVYYTKDGIIDTLPWEGVREGIDDIRYATLLLQLANRAVDEGKQKDVDKYYTGRKALQYLACVDEEQCDQDAVRAEMIRHIMAVDAVLNKKK